MRHAVALSVLIPLVVFVCACGASVPRVQESAPVFSGDSGLGPAFNGARKASDELPPGAYAEDYGAFDVDRLSSRRVPVETKRYRLWLTRGIALDGNEWRAGFDRNVVCAHLYDDRNRAVAFQCAPRTELAIPGRLLFVLSGGRQGAPGLRPHEVVIAGLAPRGASVVTAGTEKARGYARVRKGAFVLITRSYVDEVFFRDGNTVVAEVGVNTCQSC